MPATCRLAAVLALMFLALCACAHADDAAEGRVKHFLEEHNAKGYQLAPASESAAALFPGRQFFAVRFRLFPVAVVPPRPLAARNLFVVEKEGAPRLITDTAELKAFFQAALAPARDDAAAKAAARAWLQLAQALAQDGFYQFTLQDDSLTVTPAGQGRKVTGKTVVTGGGKGEITVTLNFDAAGRLTAAAEQNTLKPGVRPICQATKLLDRDPIVRRMAERDLLVMGQAAKEYLDAQRARATPALRRAIDRIWKQIVEEGW